MLKHGGGDADATGLCQRLKASCYVDSVAVDIVVSGDDVTEINANAQFNAMRIDEIGIPSEPSLAAARQRWPPPRPHSRIPPKCRRL
jgi:hypothetical protein